MTWDRAFFVRYGWRFGAGFAQSLRQRAMCARVPPGGQSPFHVLDSPWDDSSAQTRRVVRACGRGPVPASSYETT